MDKLDLRRDLEYLYQPSAKKVEVVEVPAFKFAMIDGPGMRGRRFAFQGKSLYNAGATAKGAVE
jgi:hypothetical protein